MPATPKEHEEKVPQPAGSWREQIVHVDCSAAWIKCAEHLENVADASTRNTVHGSSTSYPGQASWELLGRARSSCTGQF